ncbi:MAG: trigger factor [Alphaproteobacteria bacterium]|nr:trigger factor [Alphaproteobacteria bacterium]
MQVTETKTEGLKHGFKVVVPAETIASKVTDKIKSIGENATIPGFRKGKAPESFLRQRYEKAVMSEVLDELIQSETNKTLSERSLRPAMRPKIEIVSFDAGKDLEFTLDVEVVPEIVPVDFGTLSLDKLIAEISDDEVEKALQRLAAGRTSSEPVKEKRAAKKGDITVIDFVGSIDGVEFQGGKGDNYYLELGSGSFIPGFEDQLIGKKAGEKVDVKVPFPADYHAKDLAGKDAIFAVTVKELREKKDAEINDDFAKLFGKKSVDELRDMIRLELSREYEGVSMSNLKRVLLDALAEAHSFPVPEGMLDLEFDAIWKQVQNAKEKNQLDEDDAGKTDDELREEYRAIAERRVRLGLLLAEIGMKNKISVTDADVNRAIMMEARQFPGQEKAVFDFYNKHPEMLERIRAPLFEEKVIDFILKGVKLNEVKVSPEELYKAEAADVKKSAKKAKKTAAKKTAKAKEDAPAKETKSDKETKEKKPAKKTAKKKNG